MENTQDLQQQIQNLKNEIESLSNNYKTLKEDYNKIKLSIENHQHNNDDGTAVLRKSIRLDKDQTIKIADSEIGQQIVNPGTTNEIDQLSISVGTDPNSGFSNKSNNIQFNIVHQPRSTVSYISGQRPPLYQGVSGTSSTTSGGSTTSMNGFTFATNALAGSLINIYTSAGVFVETQLIASNTSSVITISGTWVSTTVSGQATVITPLYLGISDQPWQRLYVMDTISGGIRFGGGVTDGGQNALLYVDGADLKFRKKDGTVTTVTVV